MTFAARLGIVERSQAVGHPLDLVKFGLISLMGNVIHQSIAHVVKSRGYLRGSRRARHQGETEKDRSE
jgi:hypothetical protein